MIPMIKRHEVQVLLGQGLSPRQVARRTGIPRTSVRRIAEEDAIEEVDGRLGPAARGVGRPSEVVKYADSIQGWLQERRDLPTVEIRTASRGGLHGGG